MSAGATSPRRFSEASVPCIGSAVKSGTLVDATLIAAAVRRPYEGGGVNPRDPDTRFSVKR
jgi:hypothetical protein